MHLNNPLRITMAMLLTALAAACAPEGPDVDLALRRPAYHSSSIDYNATAQLAVDGIRETTPPQRVIVSGNGGVPLPKIQNDMLFDPRQWTSVTAEGSPSEVSVNTVGFEEPVDRISMTLAPFLPQGVRNAAYTAELQKLEADGNWATVKKFKGGLKSWMLNMEWTSPEPVSAPGWRFVVDVPGARAIQWQEWLFYRDGQLLPMLTSGHFCSVWEPASGGREWIAVDLGEERRFKEVRLDWLNAPRHGVVQVSRDSVDWRDIAAIDNDEAVRVDVVPVKAKGRWVRVLLDSSVDGEPYLLTEMKVIGPGEAGPAQPSAAVAPDSGLRFDLDRGWTLARLPQAGDPAAWIPATVPGTVLSSYLDNGMLPDPNFSDNQLYISDSYFMSPFVYRCSFKASEGWRKGDGGERIRLHFDGINWKADAVLNGQPVGRIEGAFTDASFDVTGLLAEDNTLEVTVYPPAHPGMTKENTRERCATNGGILGADNPTFHASIGWDWIPTIRGRNMGIWNDVWMEKTGAVRITGPTVRFGFNTLESMPPKIDTTHVKVFLGATLVNDSDAPAEAVWNGQFGDARFSEKATLPAGGSVPVSAVVELDNPRLWWPNGYGEPYLYDVHMGVDGSYPVDFKSGIRLLTYDDSDNNLRIWINGRRFVGRGGNWGFSDSNLRYHAAEYETAMILHQHENFNLVRNWVGMVGDEEFYEAADRHGIMVWQDFWLANPADGPDPDDEALFMANAENMLKRVRNHPSLLIWVGRNEGYPPKTLDRALRDLVAREDPGSHFISSSADDEVSGRGTYFRLPSKLYWNLDQLPQFKYESVKFHSERGMPNFPNWESLVLMMREDEAWPPSRMWGIHDFALESAQRGQTFIDAVDSFFGPSSDGPTFASRAQWVNYEGYRSLFESRSKARRGLLLWMSHPAWPSMAFCTYDWYLDPTASYYACRKACEPIHIQWNPVAEKVEVVNYYAGDRKGLRAEATLFDMGGNEVSKQEWTLDADEDTTNPLGGIDFTAAGFKPGDDTSAAICFLRLELYEGDMLLSHNDYVLPEKDDDLKALNALDNADVKIMVHPLYNSVTLKNESDVPALMLHLVARRGNGTRILPSLWSDNYIHLMPGEERTLEYWTPEGEDALRVSLEGFNLGK